MTRRARQNPTRYQRETGERLPRWRQKLAQYEAEGGYYVHFSEYPNTGVYPTNRFSTPTGFYAYPLSFEFNLQFGSDRRYAIVFKPVRARLWVLKGYSASDYSRDLKILHSAFGQLRVDEWKKQEKKRTLAGQMWNITRNLAEGNVAKWMRIIYQVLGYDGVIDDCLGIIHPGDNHWCQSVFFDMRTGSPEAPQNEKVRIVDVLEKGKSTKLKPPKGIDFQGKNLTRNNLRRLDLRNAGLARTNISGVDLSGMDLSGADLSQANLSGASLSGASLSGVNLNGANLTDADLSGAKLVGANLVGANNQVRSDEVRGLNLMGANLTGANLTRANLTRSILTGSTLIGSNLTGAKLGGANLMDANLTKANLTGAKLKGADLTDATLTDAVWAANTTWPAKFKPPATSYRRPAS